MQRDHECNTVHILALALAFLCVAVTAPIARATCGAGTGDPPFLSYGVEHNLLMLLDNSGSMLDPAYPLEKKTQCFDDSFNPASPYAGNYRDSVKEPDANGQLQEKHFWYRWAEGVDPWKRGTPYAAGSLVYDNGAIYQNLKGGTSSTTAANLYADNALEWESVLHPVWKQGTPYRAGAYVVGPLTGRWFYTKSGGTSSSSAISPDKDSVSWTPIETWLPGTTHTKGDRVFWKNVLYLAVSAGKSSGVSPLNDRGVSWQELNPFELAAHPATLDYDGKYPKFATYRGMVYRGDETTWTRVDEGYYQIIEENEATSACKSATYTSSHLCLKLETVTGVQRVTSFVATGKMLNWLMASKFDVQKSILTGGKYNSEEQRLVSESRGCSGSRFTKEVAMDQTAYDAVLKKTVPYKVVMAVRGSRIEGDPQRADRVDSYDDTTRLEVLGVSTGGYDAAACQAAVNKILANDGDLQGTQNLVDACLVGINPITSVATQLRASLNHALQTCWQNTDKSGNLPAGYLTGLHTNISDCQKLYGMIPPADIPSFHQAYNCYGYYTPVMPHKERNGYMGRCWGGDCNPTVIATPASCNGQYPCLFEYIEPGTGGGRHLLVNYQDKKTDAITTERCTSWVPADGLTCKANKWGTYYINSLDRLCEPATEAGWSSEIDGNLATTNDLYQTPLSSNDLPNITLQDGTQSKMAPQAYNCVSDAMKDFCKSSTVPEVIDASDQVMATTSTYGGFPAQLIDSGVVGQFGVDVPMLVMKGYALQATAPSGVLQENVGKLRVGAMAFNKVGASYECSAAIAANTNIEKYCLADNRDGARVIAPVRSGGWVVDDTADDRLHIHDVVAAVNHVQATAWTPLAEAMYNAIGYYTQDISKRLHDDDFRTDADSIGVRTAGVSYSPGAYAWDGDTLYYTALGGTSSSGTVAEDVVAWTKIGTNKGTWSAVTGTTYVAKDIVRDNNDKLYITALGGQPRLKTGATGSGPLWDSGVVWEPVFDPVVYHCQENHVLVITEGSSTADIAATVASFASGIADPTPQVEEQCTTSGLQGSAYLDNLTHWGQSADATSLYPIGNATLPEADPPFALMDKQPLTTHVVVTGNVLKNATSTASNECDPAVLMQNAANHGGTKAPLNAENPEKLRDQLKKLFDELRQRASAGSAASVISTARSGEGAVYQAVFWPERTLNDATENTEYKVTWVGDVHSLFIDDKGYMYEDTVPNRALDKGDRRVIVYYDEELKRTRACYGDSLLACLAVDSTAQKVELEQVKFLWSANDWLSSLELVTTNRIQQPSTDSDSTSPPAEDDSTPPSAEVPYISASKARHIFTWKGPDATNKGAVQEDDLMILEAQKAWGDLARNFLSKDFDTTPDPDAKVNRIVNWIRGEDQDGMRSRKLGATATPWRLGDIINSTPQLVAAPAEGYHLLYNDLSYGRFVATYKNRRHVVYFGANDGMLHAVNAGFYSEDDKKFCLQPLVNGSCPVADDSGAVPQLGAELWAYVPYNLQPHLKCLTEPLEKHKYYVDLKPRVFDAQIFAKDEDHPEGWGTILVGGLRFGGAPVEVPYPVVEGGKRVQPFVSSYFILDITNPEKPPVLLAELTQEFDDPFVPESVKEEDFDAVVQAKTRKWADLGYSTVIPTMVIAKEAAEGGTNKWYLVFGSGPQGPNGLLGESKQSARVSVFPLHDLVDKVTGKVSPGKALRIPKQSESHTSEARTWTLSEKLGFVADPITLDFDIGSSPRGQYVSDAVYFGTVQENPKTPGLWQGGGGSMYRLVMNEHGHQIGTDNVVDPSEWAIIPLIDLNGDADTLPQPISAAASVSTDGYNYWVYFGTGRFFDALDKADIAQQSFYGIKEPMEAKSDGGTLSRNLRWTTVSKKGLQKVDPIMVEEKSAKLACRDSETGMPVTGDTSCLPSSVAVKDNPTLWDLETYIAGKNNCTLSTSTDETLATATNCVDGWYRDFFPYENRERNVGQAALLGGLVIFTTYQPFSDACKPEGESFLYSVYYKTGTSWFKRVFGNYGIEFETYVRNKLALGRGLATSPSLFVGKDGEVKVTAQTSTAALEVISIEDLPEKYMSGRANWREFDRPDACYP